MALTDTEIRKAKAKDKAYQNERRHWGPVSLDYTCWWKALALEIPA
jgi:hypothetical protein